MFEGLDRIVFTQDWITILLLIILVLITLVKVNFPTRFDKLFSLIYSEKYYTDFIKSKPFIFNSFHAILFFVVIFNISLWCYFILQAYFPDNFEPHIMFFGKILIIAICFVFVRYYFGAFLADLFEIGSAQKYFTFLKFSNLSLIMIITFPLLIGMNYTSLDLYKFWITFGLIVLLILLIFRYFIILKNERLNFNNIFYIILYLCALELAPFIVIYKVFVD